MLTRKYLSHRRAYSPRFLPVALPTVLGWGVIAFLTVPPVWLNFLGALLFGISTTLIRWWVFRRRHPVITPEEYLEDIRRAARWN